MRRTPILGGERGRQYGNVDHFYRNYYNNMPCGREGGSVAKLAHTFMEKPFGTDNNFSEVLEVGAGFGLHLPFVRHGYDRYLMTDLNEETLNGARGRVGGHAGVEFGVADAQALPYADNSFDRLIATCILLHLPSPEQALSEWRRVVRPGGVLSIYVPNEPGLLTRTGRAVTSRRAAKRAGFEGFDLMISREHINHGWGLDQMVRYVFRADTLRAKTWPLPHGPLMSRVFTVYQVTMS